MPTSDQLLAELQALHPRLIDLSLGRIERLLAKLGNPHTSLPPVIHIAGTNGKGSTTAYLKAMLEAAGKRVHVYTSPHLVRFHERIELAGADGKATPDRRGRARRRAGAHAGANDGDDHHVSSRSRRPPPSWPSPSIRPMRCCWRSASAAGSTPPTSSHAGAYRHHARSRWTMRTSWATRSPRSPSRRPASCKPGVPAVIAQQERGRARRHPRARRSACGAPLVVWGERLRRLRAARPPRHAAGGSSSSICRCRRSSGATRSSMPARRSPLRCSCAELRHRLMNADRGGSD